MKHQYYEVRKSGDPRELHKTGGSLERDHDNACDVAQSLSMDFDGVYNVHFVGHMTDPVRSPVVFAYEHGQPTEEFTFGKVKQRAAKELATRFGIEPGDLL